MSWHTFFVYFGIPNGAVWSNVLAEPIILGLTAACVFPLRHKIGKQLAAWWHKHHGPHAVEQHLEALRRHEESKANGG